MALNAWVSGDIISEVSANNRGIRKGTESEIAAITVGNREIGSLFYNSTTGFPQIACLASTDYRGNICILLGADSTETSIASVTATQVKDIDYIKNTAAFKGNQITIVAAIKCTAGTGTLEVHKDSAVGTSLDLTTTSAAYEIKTGTLDITGDGAGVRTLEFYIKNSNGANTTYLKQLEVYGI